MVLDKVNMNETEIRGKQFEIWLELLLKRSGYQNVLRNVEYHRKRYLYRQVDVSYDLIKEGRICRAIVEAKYSSHGKIQYFLRNGEKEKRGQLIDRIDNLVDEILERKHFVHADFAVLATNKEFDSQLMAKAEHFRIFLFDRVKLTTIYLGLGGRGSIYDAIVSIDLRKHNLNKNMVYIYNSGHK